MEHFPISVAILFLVAGEADLAGKPLTVSALSEKVGMSMAATSRNIRVIGGGSPGRGGGAEQVELLKTVSDPQDYRSRLVVLTADGRRLFKELIGRFNV